VLTPAIVTPRKRSAGRLSESRSICLRRTAKWDSGQNGSPGRICFLVVLQVCGRPLVALKFGQETNVTRPRLRFAAGAPPPKGHGPAVSGPARNGPSRRAGSSARQEPISGFRVLGCAATTRGTTLDGIEPRPQRVRPLTLGRFFGPPNATLLRISRQLDDQPGATPKSERSGAPRGVWRTRLNEINPLMLTSP
jgi:hypothetical protein